MNKCWKYTGIFTEMSCMVINPANDSVVSFGPNPELQDAVSAYVNSRLSLVTEADSYAPYDLFGAFGIIDGPLPSYPPIITDYRLKDGRSNKPFQKRKKAGEVVLSDYLRASIHVESHPGIREDGRWLYPGTGSSMDIYKLRDLLGYTLISHPRYGQVLLSVKQPGYLINNVFGGSCQYSCFEDYEAVPPLNITAEEVYAMVKENESVDAGFVTNAIAKANKQMMDVLTALAELPESLKSFGTLMSQVGSIIRGVKRREVFVTTAFEKRNAILDSEWKESMRRYNNAMSDIGAEVASQDRKQRIAAKKQRRIVERNHRKTLKTYERAKRESAIEFGDALAHVWMEFRYNIMPLTYQAMEMTDVLTKDPEFLTVREKFEVNRDITIPGSFPTLTYLERFSVFIRDKAQASTGPYALYYKNMSLNIARTAWELVPLSFVVDWFVNIGDTITAFTGGSTGERNSTVAFKQTIEYNEVDPDRRRLIVNGLIYQRTVSGTLIQYACLNFEPSMTWKRWVDSSALSWNTLRESLKRSAR